MTGYALPLAHSFRRFFLDAGLIPVGICISCVHYETAANDSTFRCHRNGTGFRVFLPAGGIWQIRAGLATVRPFAQTIVGRAGWLRPQDRRDISIEVQPLVNDLNSLLEHREQIVRRALRRPASGARFEDTAGSAGTGADRVEAKGNPK